ncbi:MULTISPECIES: DUF3515 family protein [Microbacterium]|uniref:DUF3515 family protein n=1 Tax=Microbacterium TaxID=33882 RepID=UPI001F0F426C|nr:MULTISPECIES: DUF3515 family protein [Microbacterium]
MIRPRRPLAAVALSLLAAATLSGCAGTVSLQPAANAGDPACAAVSVRLPDQVSGQERRWTDAQATAAWGSPTAIILTCGVEEPGPSPLRCETVEGVDWLIDESEAADDHYRFTTFGRTPAVEVYLDYDVVRSGDTLRALSPILNPILEKTGSVCTPRA